MKCIIMNLGAFCTVELVGGPAFAHQLLIETSPKRIDKEIKACCKDVMREKGVLSSVSMRSAEQYGDWEREVPR